MDCLNYPWWFDFNRDSIEGYNVAIYRPFGRGQFTADAHRQFLFGTCRQRMVTNCAVDSFKAIGHQVPSDVLGQCGEHSIRQVLPAQMFWYGDRRSVVSAPATTTHGSREANCAWLLLPRSSLALAGII